MLINFSSVKFLIFTWVKKKTTLKYVLRVEENKSYHKKIVTTMLLKQLRNIGTIFCKNYAKRFIHFRRNPLLFLLDSPTVCTKNVFRIKNSTAIQILTIYGMRSKKQCVSPQNHQTRNVCQRSFSYKSGENSKQNIPLWPWFDFGFISRPNWFFN